MEDDTEGTGEKKPEQATLPLGTQSASPDADLKARLDALEKENRKLQAEAEKLRKAEQTKAEKKRQEEEGAAALLAEKSKTLESYEAKLKAYEEGLSSKADAAFKKLSAASKAKLEPLKGKLDLPDWLRLVEDEAAGFSEVQTNTPPPTPGPGRSRGGGGSEHYTPNKEADQMLDQVMHPEAKKMLRQLDHEARADGTNTFSMPVERMIQHMRQTAPFALIQKKE